MLCIIEMMEAPHILISTVSPENGKKILDEQTNIDLVKFANKFEAAYEIIRKWYKKGNGKCF